MTTLIDKIENNKLFKFIKENFSLIIFIPSLLGGLKQLVSLLIYSPTLIQYFSFSQIAIDGLETIIQGIYVFLIVSCVYSLTAGKTLRIIFSNIFSLIILGIYTWYAADTDNLYKIAPYNLTTLDTYLFKLFSLTFLGVTLGNIFVGRSINFESSRNLKYFENIYTSFSLLLLVYLIISYKPFQYNVKNVIDVTNKVKKEISKNAELIHYNDSYLIFILNPKEDFNHRKFYVQKFETLFEEKDDNKGKK